MHFGRPLIECYSSADSKETQKQIACIYSPKADDINPTVCERVKIGLAGRQIPFVGTDPDH